MKGLKKLALVTAISAVPFAAQAEMQALNDTAMGDVTGQAGVSIELAAAVTVGEIAYKDEGFIAINNLRLAGADVATNADSRLDNILMKIDVAGDATDASALSTQWGLNTLLAAAGAPNAASTPAIEDGDLVIHLGTQGTVTDPASLTQADNGISVDYGLSIDSVGLAKSGSTLGNLATDQGTVLVSDLNLTGYLGPIDIVIQEEVAADTQVMNINAFFTTTGTITADFVGTTFGLNIADTRGATVSPIGMAHVQLDIGTRENDLGETDGLVVNVQDFSGDIDMTDITMGAAAGRAAIGDLYMTDVAVKAEMVIYGH